jgi:hypothetical protein
VLDLMTGLRKDSAGDNLKQLFIGATAVAIPSQRFADSITTETARWKKVIETAKITIPSQ